MWNMIISIYYIRYFWDGCVSISAPLGGSRRWRWFQPSPLVLRRVLAKIFVFPRILDLTEFLLFLRVFMARSVMIVKPRCQGPLWGRRIKEDFPAPSHPRSRGLPWCRLRAARPRRSRGRWLTPAHQGWAFPRSCGRWGINPGIKGGMQPGPAPAPGAAWAAPPAGTRMGPYVTRGRGRSPGPERSRSRGRAPGEHGRGQPSPLPSSAHPSLHPLHPRRGFPRGRGSATDPRQVRERRGGRGAAGARGAWGEGPRPGPSLRQRWRWSGCHPGKAPAESNELIIH